MQYIENVMLYCLKQINGERTIYSIYHLLNGKKSSQTIQDAHLFSLKRYFRILETLTRESFDKAFNRLVDKDLVETCGEQKFLLRGSGEAYLQKSLSPNYLNGWEYQHFTPLVWERLSLLIQVTSNLSFKETRYIPIQKNKEVHNWLKVILKNYSLPKNEIGKNLFTELVDCLEAVKDINPAVLVYRLTGYQQIGLTAQQTAMKLNMDPIQYQLEFINIIHYIMHMVENDPGRFKLLSTLLGDLVQTNSLTLSSQKTWELLNRGYSIEQIAKYRKLKVSTIEDHLVEFALNIEEFPIDSYVDQELQNKVLEISRQTATKQLKVIRSSLKTASYFQIRLVLAKYGDRQWN
jgi:uncharacterized protein YpbB